MARVCTTIPALLLLVAGCQAPSKVREWHRRYMAASNAHGPGVPQPSDHCPTTPGTWFAGSGRSTATSNVFGDLTQVEVYCVNRDRAALSGGMATWTDSDGDTIAMSFGARLLKGFAYTPPPSAPLIGFAKLTRGTGKWSGIVGDALLTRHQDGDGTATLVYRGSVYLPK